MKLAARRRVLAQAASGKPCIVVATHAAFSKTFQAPNLALAVIDEQHRFGVEQRESLNAKGSTAPHLLVMTATPIPRTAAMTWFGDLDISWLTELPGGPQADPHIRRARSERPVMAEMFGLIRKRIDAGERAYVVCRASTPTRRMPTMRAVQAMRKSVPHSTPHTIWARTTNSANSGRRCIPSRKSRNACDRCRNSPASASPR